MLTSRRINVIADKKTTPSVVSNRLPECICWVRSLSWLRIIPISCNDGFGSQISMECNSLRIRFDVLIHWRIHLSSSSDPIDASLVAKQSVVDSFVHTWPTIGLKNGISRIRSSSCAIKAKTTDFLGDIIRSQVTDGSNSPCLVGMSNNFLSVNLKPLCWSRYVLIASWRIPNTIRLWSFRYMSNRFVMHCVR